MAKTAEISKVKFLEVKVASGQLAFVFGDKGRIEFDPARCSDEIRSAAMMHGFNQKIRDAAAGYSKDGDYAGAREEMHAVIEALYAGSWNRAAGGAGPGTNMEDLATAIATIKSAPFEKAMTAVRAASDEQRKAWAKNPKVAALVTKARAERLAKAAEIATDELDIDLGGETEA